MKYLFTLCHLICIHYSSFRINHASGFTLDLKTELKKKTYKTLTHFKSMLTELQILASISLEAFSLA